MSTVQQTNERRYKMEELDDIYEDDDQVGPPDYVRECLVLGHCKYGWRYSPTYCERSNEDGKCPIWKQNKQTYDD